MNPERWQQIDELFLAALERDPGERAAFLSEACAGDESLRREVESLIASYERSGGFIETAALEAAAEVLADDQAKLVAGQHIGHYKIMAALGEGGMGEVYLAEDTNLGRKVALKLLPAHLTKDADRLHRFQQEARAASALNHPNILTIHEMGQVNSVPFIATEFIEGETLRERVATARMEIGEALDVAMQVASALAAAHAAGIVHRDVKPENVMLRRDGIIKVLDFGLAKLTERQAADSKAPTRVNTAAGMVMGTAQYMSPEQARGLQVDARTDIWSLGVVLYEMAAGRAPFEGQTTSDVISLILQKEPVPLTKCSKGTPEALEWIVMKALRKEREERYQTTKDLLSDLRRLKQRLEFEAHRERSMSADLSSGVTAGGSTEATPPTAAQARPLGRRLLAASLAGVLALVAIALLWRGRFPGRTPETPPNLTARQVTANPLEDPVHRAAISPDGKYLAYPDATGIHVHLIDTAETRLIPAPEGLCFT